MSVIFILIAVSLIVATGFLIAFLWAVKNGQYEDGYSSSVRMLIDNPTKKEEEITQNNNESKNPNQ